MQISTAVTPIDAVSTQALVIPVIDSAPLGPDLTRLDSNLGGLFATLAETGALTGKRDNREIVHTLGRLPAERIAVVGLGDPRQLDLKRLTDWSIATARLLCRARVTRAAVRLPAVVGATAASIARAATEGLELGASDFRKYKSGDASNAPGLLALTLLADDEAERAAFAEGIAIGEAVATGMTLARDLANEPGNVATPRYLAERAAAMAEAHGLGCQILELEQLQELGMGALLGVAQGSDEPPRLIVLDKPGPEGADTIVLVGKGITFDSGGISIKPARKMHEMKFDMAGGAAVIGAMRALAELTPAVRVVGLVPCAENMPSGRALKPGDIVTAMSGVTIEVTNTDAEGRLILADALTYGKRFSPAAMIDIATLTGSVVTALGHHGLGAMSNDPALLERVRAAGERTGERVWPLPLWPEFLDDMKGTSADLINAYEGGGGACTAAAFLSKFAGETAWVHLDIAGVAWIEGRADSGLTGATGAGVRTLVETILSWA